VATHHWPKWLRKELQGPHVFTNNKVTIFQLFFQVS